MNGLTKLIAIAALAIASTAHAAVIATRQPSSPPPSSALESSHGMVPFEAAQRAMPFSSDRNWYAQDGSILVCPYQYDAYNTQCKDDIKGSPTRWISLENLKLPGYEIAGFQYVFVGTGGYRQLIVYWRKVNP